MALPFSPTRAKTVSPFFVMQMRVLQNERVTGQRVSWGHRRTNYPLSSHVHDYLSTGLVRLHQPVRCLDIFETKHAGRLCLIESSGRIVGDLLERNLAEWIILGAEDERAGECAEVGAARHLEDRIKLGQRRAAAKKPCQANATAPPNRRQRIEHGRGADKVQHRIDASRRDIMQLRRQFVAANYDMRRAEPVQHISAIPSARGGDRSHSQTSCDVQGRLAKRRSRPSDHQRLAGSQLEISNQARPSSGVGFRKSRIRVFSNSQVVGMVWLMVRLLRSLNWEEDTR